MTKTDSAVTATQSGSLIRGWPALLVTVSVALAAIYSFSHRPPPEFPVTRVHADSLLVNTLAQQGERYLAAGEQGRILYADQPDGDWLEAKVEPQRHSTLTALAFVAPDVALAVGHDSWILRSSDRGQSWREVHFASDRSEPLLGISGPYDGKLFAYGSFGQFMVSTDLGEHWQTVPLVDEDAATDAATDGGEVDVTSPDYDPFAAYTAGGGGGGGIDERHLNGLIQAADGTLWLVGERGLLAQSRNGGDSWKRVDGVYSGSFFGILELPQGAGLVVYGMRGNVFFSRDGGRSWTQSRVQVPVSVFDGALAADGSVILAGSGDVILQSKDQGASFQLVSQKDRRGIAAVLPLADGSWLTGGEAGIKRQTPGFGAQRTDGQ